MPLPVCTIGHRFRGYCKECDAIVEGTMITGSPDRMIEHMDICVTGSIGQGDCGHTCYSIGQSVVWFIDDLPVVRIGDPVAGTIEGELITGWDFVTSD